MHPRAINITLTQLRIWIKSNIKRTMSPIPTHNKLPRQIRHRSRHTTFITKLIPHSPRTSTVGLSWWWPDGKPICTIRRRGLRSSRPAIKINIITAGVGTEHYKSSNKKYSSNFRCCRNLGSIRRNRSYCKTNNKYIIPTN